jgi:NCAIR mutase (PurE)-related protein
MTRAHPFAPPAAAERDDACGAVMDWGRTARVGLPEAVYAPGKTAAQVDAIVAEALGLGERLLITGLDADKHAALADASRTRLDYHPRSRTAILGAIETPADAAVAVVTGGLADRPVAEEAIRTLAFSGVGATCFGDVGVAGLWRLLDRIDEIRRFSVVIAVAGMEGALFSVLAGLIPQPIVALPASVGRGVAAGGRVALESALASCAPGLVAVNIDNGFGAAQAALRILRVGRPDPRP